MSCATRCVAGVCRVPCTRCFGRAAPRAPAPLTICTHAPSTLRAACAPRSCPYIYMLLAPKSSANRTPPLRMCPSFASAGDRGWPAHLLRKPQPTSNRSPQSLSAGGRALSSAPTVGYARKREKHALRVVGEVCWSTCGSGYGVCGSVSREDVDARAARASRISV